MKKTTLLFTLLTLLVVAVTNAQEVLVVEPGAAGVLNAAIAEHG